MFIQLGGLCNRAVAFRELFVELLQLLLYMREQRSKLPWQCPMQQRRLQSDRKGLGAARQRITEFKQQAAGAVDQGRALFFPTLSQSMACETRLLRFGLDGDEAHLCLPNRNGDRLGVVVIILCAAAFAERLHEFSGHQFGYQAHRLHLARPEMGAAAGFHADHRPGLQLYQPLAEISRSQIARLHYVPTAIHGANRNDFLCKINANCHNIHDDFSIVI
jgi:hypothetical protein